MSHLSSLKNCRTPTDLAKLLGYKLNTLTYIIYGQSDQNKYNRFDIPKSSGGVRVISAPEPKLKDLQKRLAKLLMHCLDEIDNYEKVPAVSQAFRLGRTIKTNASKHKRQTHVLNFDLEDFFSSINFGRIQGFFIKNKYFLTPPKVANLLAQICVHKGSLPQGAPTSPVMSNLIARPLDRKLLLLSKKSDCIYSRYADDITISTSKGKLPEKIVKYSQPDREELSNAIENIIKKSGFSINAQKTRLSTKYSRQEVTGLTVNRKVNVRNEYYRISRAQVDSLIKRGHFESEKPYKEHNTLAQLEGKLAHIYYIKWPYDWSWLASRDSSNKVMKDFMFSKELERKHKIPNYLRVYKKLLTYKLISAERKPIILTEGKTDITHIKSAIKSRQGYFPKLYNDSRDEKFSIQFIKQSSRISLFLGLSNGASSYASFISDYRMLCESMPAISPNHPVIILVDNDDGVRTIKKSCGKHKCDISVDTEEDFYRIWSNLYVIKTNSTANLKETSIEDLHTEETLDTEINGKKFKKSKAHKENQYIGKEIFASYISENRDKIDFSGFDVLLSRIQKVIDHFSSVKK